MLGQMLPLEISISKFLKSCGKRENALVMMLSTFSKRKTDLQADGVCGISACGVSASRGLEGRGEDGWCVWGQEEGGGNIGGPGDLGESQT